MEPLTQRYQYPNEETKDLFQAILRLETLDDCEQFFRDLCTMNELKTMTERWSIAKLVHMGFPYRAISRKTGASSATIARVAHWLVYGTGAYVKACKEREELLALHYDHAALSSIEKSAANISLENKMIMVH